MSDNTAPRAPKPKPPVLTPEQEAHLIDVRNKQARTLKPTTPKAALKPQANSSTP